MSGTSRNRSRVLWLGVVLAALTGVLFAMNLTAVPAVVDVPLATLVTAALAAVVLVAALLRASRATRAARVHSGLGGVALLLVLICGALSLKERLLSYQAVEAHFSNEGVDLVGTLYLPRAGGRHSAVIFVHGSGPETRKEYAYFARLFARNGFAALAYDKRGVGQSSGRLYESDYRDYAKDVLAAIGYLRSLNEVDPGCIGLVGFSEGEWVAPLAASLSDGVAFLIVVAPSGLSPAAQVNAEIKLRLSRLGYATADVDRALALNERIFEYQRTGRAPDGLAEELRNASHEAWFRDAHDIPAELYPPEDYRWWRSVMDFAPEPVWQQVRQPVLLLKGGRDPNSTADVARQRIETALRSAGNGDVEFVLFPDGDHAMLRWPLGERVPPPVFASGYLQTMLRFAREHRCARR